MSKSGFFFPSAINTNLRKFYDEAVRICHSAYFVHQLQIGIRIPHPKIAFDGIVEKNWFLLDDTDDAPQPANVHITNIVPVNGDASRIGFV